MKRTLKLNLEGQEFTVVARREGNDIIIERDGATYTVTVVPEKRPQSAPAQPKSAPKPAAAPTPRPAAAPSAAPAAAGPGAVPAPMTGTVKEIMVAVGDSVNEGEQIMLMEAMKMDIEVAAPASGKVSEIYSKPGDSIKEGQAVMKIE